MRLSSVPKASKNEFGKSIVVPLPLGIYFCVVYPPTRFDTRIKIGIHSDGKTIDLVQPRPIPRSASELLSGYSFGNNRNDVVYASTEAVLYQMHKKLEDWERNVETSLLEFEEELYPYFVDQHGAYSNSYESNIEEQRITFFVRTMESARTMKVSSWCMNQHGLQARAKPTHGREEARSSEPEVARDTRSMNTGSSYFDREAFAPHWDTSNDHTCGRGPDQQFIHSPGHGRVDVPPATRPEVHRFHQTLAQEQRREEISSSFTAYHENAERKHAASRAVSHDEANMLTIDRLERELNELRASKQNKTDRPHLIE